MMKKMMSKVKDMVTKVADRLTRRLDNRISADAHLMVALGLGDLNATKLEAATLTWVKGHLIKTYNLTVSGCDHVNVLPGGKGRDFSMTFTFKSLYSKSAITRALSGATSVGIDRELRYNMSFLTFTKDGKKKVMVHTSPTKHSKNYTAATMLDFRSVLVEKATTVEIPNGLVFE